MVRIKSTTRVIDALGGCSAVADLVGARHRQTVHNWTRMKKFPAHTFDTISKALAKVGKYAPPDLFSQTAHGRGRRKARRR